MSPEEVRKHLVEILKNAAPLKESEKLPVNEAYKGPPPEEGDYDEYGDYSSSSSSEE